MKPKTLYRDPSIASRVAVKVLKVVEVLQRTN